MFLWRFACLTLFFFKFCFCCFCCLLDCFPFYLLFFVVVCKTYGDIQLDSICTVSGGREGGGGGVEECMGKGVG